MLRSRSLALALVACGAFAAPAAAQTLDFSRELDQLHAAVMGLAASSTDYQADLAVVTRLHGKVAALRDADDPARSQCLMDQAELLLASGDLNGARSFVAEANRATMRQAAQIATPRFRIGNDGVVNVDE